MNYDRRRLLQLLPLSTFATLVGCSESDDEKIARVERALEARRNGPVVMDKPPEDLVKRVDELDDPTKKVVVLAASNLQDSFLFQQSGLMEMALRKLPNFAFKVFDAAGDSQKQFTQLSGLRGKRPAFLLLSPVDAAAAAKIAEEFRREGTFVIGLDERLSAASCSTVIFANQKNMGLLAGHEIVAALRRKATDDGKSAVSGRVVHLTGDEASFTTRARTDGLLEALKLEPGIVLVHQAAAKWSREGGKARTEDALRLQHEFDVVCAQNELMAQGAGDALLAHQMRERVLIVGMDGGVGMVRKGSIDVSILQPMALQTAYDFIAKAAEDPHFMPAPKTELQSKALTPVNIDDFVAEALRNAKGQQ